MNTGWVMTAKDEQEYKTFEALTPEEKERYALKGYSFDVLCKALGKLSRAMAEQQLDINRRMGEMPANTETAR